MRHHTWITPVVGFIVAIALGVGIAVVVTAAAPQAPAATPGETITAPVLAPVDETDVNPDDYELSAVTGSRDVVKPSAGDVVTDETIDDILADVNDDPNPELSLELYDGGESAVGDPCSPTDGDPAEDCPDGIHSAIFALTMEPPLELTVQAFPPRTRADAALNPAGPIWCAPETLLAGDVMIGILASKPADITLSIVNENPPNDNTTYEVPRDAAMEADWHAAFDDARLYSDLPPLVYCIVVHDLLPANPYIAQVSSIEPSGEVVTDQVHFNSDRAPVRPEAQFFTLGDNYIFASGLRPIDQQLSFRAWLINGLAEEPTCAAPDGTPVSAIAGRESHVDAATLASLNVFPEYDTRSSVVFRIPEGATLLTCARWYPRGDDDPSWVRDQPSWQSERIFGAPDRIMPIVRINPRMTGGLRDPDGIDDVRVNVATAEGITCGEADLFNGGDSIRPVSADLCDTSVLALGGAQRQGSDRFWDVGFSGDLTFTVTTTLTTGESRDTTWVLPSSEQTCWGTCELPATTGFLIPIPAVHQEFDCGESSPFHLSRQPCFLIPQPDDGWVGLQVDWVQGLQNGVGRDWRESPGPDGGVDYVRPDDPQLDTTKALVAGEVDPISHTGSGSFTLVADRRVYYDATILDITGGDACFDGTDADTIVRTVSGRTATTRAPVEIRFDHLCLGRLYTVQVTLRGSSSGMSVWGISSDHRWPSPRSVLAIGGVEVSTFTEWAIELNDPTLRVGNIHATFGRQPIDIPSGGSCMSSDGNAASTDRTYDANPRRLGSYSTLHLTYWVIEPSGNPADEGCRNGRVVDARTVDVPVHLADVIDNEEGYQNVIIEPDGDPGVTIRLTIGRG
jgi:hypothetical protein